MAPLTYFNDGGTGVRVIFFGSEILAKSDCLGSMKDAGIFLGRERKTEGFGGGGGVARKGLRYFLAMLKNSSDFFG